MTKRAFIAMLALGACCVSGAAGANAPA